MSEEIKQTPKAQKRKWRWWQILLLVLACIVVLWSVLSIIGAVGVAVNTKKALAYQKVSYDSQLVPTKDTDGYWTFTTDRDFKVLMFSDLHLGGGFMSIDEDAKVLNAVACMVSTEKPDLVVFSGDITFPVPYIAGTNNNKRPTNMFIEVMENLGVYWTITYGNHDSEIYSTHTGAQIAQMYSNPDLKYCLFQNSPENVDGNGNSIIKVKNSAGIVTQTIFLLDSHSYIDGDYLGINWWYDNIHENQLEWYENEVNRISASNKAIDDNQGVVKSIAFFHIPLQEFRDAYNDYLGNNKQDTADTKYYYGVVGESEPYVFSPKNADNVFETFVRVGSTQATFHGHDHDNNISLEYKGIRMTYTYSIDYLAYFNVDKRGYQRGCTVITLSPDGSLDCKGENYYQEKYVPLYEKETVKMEK